MEMSNIRKAYLGGVAVSGMGLFLWALPRVIQGNLPLFIALLMLAFVVQATSTVNRHAGITFSVNQAVNMAAHVVLGAPAAIVIAVLGSTFSWLFNKYTARSGWKGSWVQLAFNAGMIALVMGMTGLVYNAISQAPFWPSASWAIPCAWIFASIINDQLNIWFVAIIVYLQTEKSPITFWHSNAWLMPVNMLIFVLGGGFLATCINLLSYRGILLFGLPLALASYSLRLYMRKSEQQMGMLKARSEELEKANAQLEQMVSGKDRFLQVLSHDMRTSLTAIRLYGQMLVDRGDALPLQKKERMLKAIIQSERTLTDMVNNMLEIERLQMNDDVEPALSKFDLHELIERVAASLEVHVLDKQHHLFVKNLHSQSVMVEADERMLRTVALNLLSNAIKYTPTGGSINVALNVEGDTIRVDVTDTGFGIPTAHLEQIFEPYHRVPEHVNRALGTGLGLSIVKRFVDAHDGRIEVESQVSIGSTFSFWLPALSTGDAVKYLYEPQKAVATNPQFQLGMMPLSAELSATSLS